MEEEHGHPGQARASGRPTTKNGADCYVQRCAVVAEDDIPVVAPMGFIDLGGVVGGATASGTGLPNVSDVGEDCTVHTSLFRDRRADVALEAVRSGEAKEPTRTRIRRYQQRCRRRGLLIVSACLSESLLAWRALASVQGMRTQGVYDGLRQVTTDKG